MYVVGKPRQNLARACRGVEAERDALQMREQADAQIAHDPLPNGGAEEALRQIDQPIDTIRGQQRQHKHRQQRAILA